MPTFTWLKNENPDYIKFGAEFNQRVQSWGLNDLLIGKTLKEKTAGPHMPVPENVALLS